jgi:ribosomal protein S18 acetylase RimI-like enzyme
MELREATEDDLGELADRWYDLAQAMASYSELNRLVFDDREEVSVGGFRAHLDDDAVTDFLVVEDGTTIGFLTVREGTHPSREYSQYLRIVNIAIDEGYRSQGYGTEIVERVREMAHERGCDHLKVGCEYDNEGARRFYREAGFEPKQVEYAQPLE